MKPRHTGKAAHLLRSQDAAAALLAARRKAARAAPVAKGAAPMQYAPGYFTQLMCAHDWPPGFVPSAAADVVAKLGRPRVDAPVVRALQCRGGGFDGLPLNLPGAIRHLLRGPLPPPTRGRL